MTPKQYVKMLWPDAECRKIKVRRFGVYLKGLSGRPLFGPGMRIKEPDCTGLSAPAAWHAAFEHVQSEIIDP